MTDDLRALCPNFHRCNKYFELRQIIDRRDERIRRQDARIARLERELERLRAEAAGGACGTGPKPPFGSSTPSSKIPVKPNSGEEARLRRGGRPKGHAGSGRAAFDGTEPGLRESDVWPEEETCPDCGLRLVEVSVKDRSFHDADAAVAHKSLVHIHRRICPKCKRTYAGRPPHVLPRVGLGNRLGAQAVWDMTVAGIPMRRLARRLGIKYGSLKSFVSCAADLLEPAMDRLLEDFRAAAVKHADETTWRCDGKNGYAWGFFSPLVALYRFRQTRSADVPREVFGEGPHAGVLVVDRYSAYPAAWRGKLQDCFEHLKRRCGDILESGVADDLSRKALEEMLDCLRRAMRLRRTASADSYGPESLALRDRMVALAGTKVRDGAADGFLDIFREHPERLFQWANHPEVPAENNFAERGVRPLVLARKSCFGSQSEKGLRTREILTSVMHTLALRHEDPVEVLRRGFDAYSRDPSANIAEILFPKRE